MFFGMLLLNLWITESSIWNSVVSLGSMSPPIESSYFVLNRPLNVLTLPRIAVALMYRVNESVNPAGWVVTAFAVERR